MATGERDPLRELQTVQSRMNKLFESALGRTDFDTQDGFDSWTPVADVLESDEVLVLCLELPGLEQEKIDIHVEGDELVVAGERGIDRERPGEHFHRVERSYGKFGRRFRLPSTVDRNSIQAVYRDGVLRITLSRHGEKQAEPFRVEIR